MLSAHNPPAIVRHDTQVETEGLSNLELFLQHADELYASKRLPVVTGVIRLKSDINFKAPISLQIDKDPPLRAIVATIKKRAATAPVSRPAEREDISSPYAATGPTRRRCSTRRSTAMVENLTVYDEPEELLEIVGLANCPMCGTEIEADMPACHRHLTFVLLKAIGG